MTDQPRFGFPPLERRGVLLGVRAGQLGLAASGALGALLVHWVVPGTGGTLAAVSTLTVVTALALGTRDGRSWSSWAATYTSWLARSRHGWRTSDRPGVGAPPGATAGALPPLRLGPRRRRGRVRPAPLVAADLAPAGLRIIGAPTSVGGSDMAVVTDPSTVAAVMEVAGRSFGLLDPAEQAARLDDWRALLAGLARSASPVTRIQWVARSTPGSRRTEPGSPPALPVDASGRSLGGSDPPDPRLSYARMVAEFTPRLGERRTWVVLVVDRGRRSAASRPPTDREVAELGREMRFLYGQLRSADLDPGSPLGPSELAEVLAAAAVGEGRPASTLGSSGARGRHRSVWPWPMADDERWAEHRTDGLRHVTYWVSEWPAAGAGPQFLLPLLVVPERVAVSVVMGPVPTSRALREARSARTADLADAELRSRAGFLASTRREREAEGVAQREAELADGHQEFRFSGYVTVSAVGEEELRASCAAVEHTAESCRLELRRLYGQQAEAFTWTLPLGRGLR